jgi:cytochrome c-type biogenesis protein CcmH/NrfG
MRAIDSTRSRPVFGFLDAGLRDSFDMKAVVFLVCALVTVPGWTRQQTQTTTRQTTKSQTPTQQTTTSQQQPAPAPDETNPPEEDASVAPTTYAFDPLEAQRCINIGNFYMHKGSKGYRAALGRYEDATKYDPHSAEAFFKVGEVEEKLNNKDAAKLAFQRVLKLAPESKFASEAKKKLAKLS